MKDSEEERLQVAQENSSMLSHRTIQSRCISGRLEGAMGIHYFCGGSSVRRRPEASRVQVTVYHYDATQINVRLPMRCPGWMAQIFSAPYERKPGRLDKGTSAVKLTLSAIFRSVPMSGKRV